jgi:5-methylthioadenosine/S-adenosylhomocysteine deaminase
MITGGTTCALSMETVHHTDSVFEAVEESGFRATLGKCMMDQGNDLPDGLREGTRESIEASLRLMTRWHGAANGRIRYCFAPRFAVSCTKELLEETALLARRHGVMIHTHASENKDEIDLVRRMTGRRNIEYLRDVGISGPNVVLAHCIHIDRDEIDILSTSGTRVAHCPSSNLKLGSGIARTLELIDAGVEVSLGADGAPCNNRLDMFTEMRTAALLQKVLHGPKHLPAGMVLKMATSGGARALGLEKTIGSIEEGKRADIVLLDLNRIHTTPHSDPISTIVYAADRTNIETVIIDGKIVLRNQSLQTIDQARLIARINEVSGRHENANRPQV